MTAGAIFAGGAGGCDVGEMLTAKEQVYTSAEWVTVAQAVISPEESARISDTYTRLQKYWQGSLTAELVILQGADRTVCTETKSVDYMRRATEGAAYCSSTDKVVMTGGFVAGDNQHFSQGDSKLAMMGITLATAHEAGHGVEAQTAKGRAGLDAASGSPEHKQAELSAEYNAGQFICGDGGYSPEDITHAKIFLSRLDPDDFGHGTPAERLGVFNSGLAAAGCNPFEA